MELNYNWVSNLLAATKLHKQVPHPVPLMRQNQSVRATSLMILITYKQWHGHCNYSLQSDCDKHAQQITPSDQAAFQRCASVLFCAHVTRCYNRWRAPAGRGALKMQEWKTQERQRVEIRQTENYKIPVVKLKRIRLSLRQAVNNAHEQR